MVQEKYYMELRLRVKGEKYARPFTWRKILEVIPCSAELLKLED